MRNALLSTVVVLALLFGATASATDNACSTWNQFAGHYGFGNYPQDQATTFRQAYSGDNFDADFQGILDAVSRAMHVEQPIIGGDDLFNYSLEGWTSGTGN